MFVIQDTLVSLDVLEKEFSCDLAACCGKCCVEGDAGAPVSGEELQEIERIIPIVEPLMSRKARKILKEQGLSYLDPSGERVLSIVDGAECIFMQRDSRRWCYCLLEQVYEQGKTTWRKPLSCALYPVRLTRVGGKVGVEYHRWDICYPARLLGKKNHMPLYRFLKEPLIRRFGKEWYDELELTAKEWDRQCKQKSLQ